jgi:hypothetical protein
MPWAGATDLGEDTLVTGDAREAAEARLLTKLSALTTADGLPQVFGLVTRELLHFTDIKTSQLPGCLLQMEEPEVVHKLSHVIEVNLPGRIVVFFPASASLPASTANAYRSALEKMIMSDIHLGGLVDACWIRGTLMPGLWEGTSLLGMGLLISLLYEYDGRLTPIAA